MSLTTRQIHSQVEVTVEDNSKGHVGEELANIFDPAFKVKGRPGLHRKLGPLQFPPDCAGTRRRHRDRQHSRQGDKMRVTLPYSENT